MISEILGSMRKRLGPTMTILKLMRNESGATAVEYGLLSAIISVALLSGFGAFSNALTVQFQYLANIIYN